MPYPTSTIELLCKEEEKDISVKYFNLDDFSVLFDQISTMWGVKILKSIYFIGSYHVKELLSILYPINDKIKEYNKNIESYTNIIKMCSKMIDSVVDTIDEYDETNNNERIYYQTNQLINYINLFIDLYIYQLELCYSIFSVLNDKKLISDDMFSEIGYRYESCYYIFSEIFKNVFGGSNYGLSKKNFVFSKQFVLDKIMKKECQHHPDDFDSYVRFNELSREPFDKPKSIIFNNINDKNAIRRILHHIKYINKNKDIDDNVHDINMSLVFPSSNNSLYKINNLEYNSSGFNNKESIDKYNYFASKYIFALKDYNDEKIKFDEQNDINNKNKKQTGEQNISINEDIISDDFTEASDTETYDYISSRPPINKNNIKKLFKLMMKSKKGLYY